MSTHRERREARAQRLNEWAEKREAKSEAMHNAGDLRSGIPMGQPILVGHHSQRRHENAIERANSATRRALDNDTKAASMRARAANIEAAADRAIYSDDEDAAERLRERVAELTEQQAAMKARNAAFRAANREALKAMTPFARGRTLPHPPYELTNLAANIRRNRERLAAMQAQA